MEGYVRPDYKPNYMCFQKWINLKLEGNDIQNAIDFLAKEIAYYAGLDERETFTKEARILRRLENGKKELEARLS